MNTQNITPDDILSDEENRRLSEMMSIKKHVYAFINKDKLVQYILHLIDRTGFVRFERKHDRRFVTLTNLSMSLVFDVAKAVELYGVEGIRSSDGLSRDDIINNRAAFLRETIVVPFTDLMSNMLGTIIDKEPSKEYEDLQWVFDILPENYRKLRTTVNNFIDLSDEERERMKQDFRFMFGMASAFIFPPDGIDLDEDEGFTLEFLL
jgi:hypothetical protein